MPLINIPLGSQISTIPTKSIEVTITNTNYTIEAEQNTETKRWDIYIKNNQTGDKKPTKQKPTTQILKMIVTLVLNKPFPELGKEPIDIKKIIKYLNKIIRKIHARK